MVLVLLSSNFERLNGLPYTRWSFIDKFLQTQVINGINRTKHNFPLVARCTLPKEERELAVAMVVATLESFTDAPVVKMALQVRHFGLEFNFPKVLTA